MSGNIILFNFHVVCTGLLCFLLLPRSVDFVFSFFFSFFFVIYGLTDTMVEPVPESIHFPSEEEKILELWTEKDCFQECLKQSKNRPK